MKLRYLFKNLRLAGAKREDFLLRRGGDARYVAIIMDGNNRWAAERRLPAIAGHREGAKTLKRIIRSAKQQGIEELTVYAFSTENWNRPKGEVDALMDMFGELIDKEVPELNDNNVRVRFVGRSDGLSSGIREKIRYAEELTTDNDAMTIFIAFNYGGRAEILDAVKAALGNGAGEVDEDGFKKYLYAPDMHDPELLIRTSGEMRISNFLLWQCAYAELFFSDKYWPSFTEDDLKEALDDYKSRKRRFGAR